MESPARSSRTALAGMALAAVVVLLASAAGAEVTTLQQGLSPDAKYAGCQDTFIVGHGWAHDRPSNRPRSETLSSRALIRFDLAGVGKERVVRRAILRLWCSAVPSSGQTPMEVRTFARDWDISATWYEHKYKDAKKTNENNWTTFGGDLDDADMGRGKPGLVASAPVRGGPFGHVFELDVTALVADWVSGARPNYGFCISAERGHFSIASADWPMARYRPELIVEHYRKGEAPAKDVTLELPQALGKGATLSSLAAGGEVAGEKWTTVRFGRNANCQYRGGHAAEYLKTDPRFPGRWDWTPRLRVGGAAGDFNHALLKFDLAAITKGAKIQKAVLKACVDVGNLRLPKGVLYKEPNDNPDREKRRINYIRGRMSELSRYSFGAFAAVGGLTPPGRAGSAVSTFIPPGRVRPTGRKGVAAQVAPAAVCHVGKQWAEAMKVRDGAPPSWLEWDVTGLVQAWVGGKLPNCGVVIDHWLMGGEMVLYSDDWYEADLRPYLEVTLTPAPTKKADAELKDEPLLPEGDYWVEPMAKAHAKWKGTKGTFGEYGDSITVTLAFWTPLLYGDRKGMTPEMKEALETARKYIHKPCWRSRPWKEWTNAGNMTINWAFRNVDAWQKKLNPEVSVILFGTNDAGYGPHPPHYTEQYAAVIDRMLADGTIPIITTLPPRGSQRGSRGGLLTVLDLRQAAIAVAKAKKVPLIDFYTEMVKRQPDNWPKILVPDGLHPSYPKNYQRDWTEEGLANSGYTLRNYLTLRKWHEIYTKVLTK